MDWGSPIAGCIWFPRSSRPSRWRTSWGQQSWPRIWSDECLGRTLDWLYAHDPTSLFAGIATQARRRLGLSARELHVDTTSCAVNGEYAQDAGDDVDAQAIAITYGYSRDHRQDLKQWMLALATSGEGAIPVFLRPLDGNASDQRELAQTIEALVTQLRADGEQPGI